ncbi:MAG: hypothetical protein U0N16_00790, partial [Desulfovibrio sp.]
IKVVIVIVEKNSGHGNHPPLLEMHRKASVRSDIPAAVHEKRDFSLHRETNIMIFQGEVN